MREKERRDNVTILFPHLCGHFYEPAETLRAAGRQPTHPGLNFNFTVLELNAMLQELFKYDPQHPEVAVPLSAFGAMAEVVEEVNGVGGAGGDGGGAMLSFGFGKTRERRRFPRLKQQPANGRTTPVSPAQNQELSLLKATGQEIGRKAQQDKEEASKESKKRT